MKSIQRFLAVSLSLALIAVAPGLAPYQAAAQIVEVPGQTAAPVMPAIVLPGALNIAAPSAVGSPASLNGLVLPSLQLSNLSAPSGASSVSPVSAASASGVRSAASSRAAYVPAAATYRAAQRPASAARASGPSLAASVAAGLETVQKLLASPASTVELQPVSGRAFDNGRASAESPTAVSVGLSAKDKGDRMPELQALPRRTRLASFESVRTESGSASLGFMEPSARTGRSESPDVNSRPSASSEESSRGLLANGGAPQLDKKQLMKIGLGIAAAVVVYKAVTGGVPALLRIGIFLATYALIVLPSIIWHERGHAKMGLKLGDDRDALKARLSLNPKVHIDPWMTVGFPLMMMLMGLPGLGMAIPVQVRDDNFKNVREAYARGDYQGMDKARRVGMAKVALAGPMANFQLALVGAVAYRVLTFFMDPTGSLLAMAVEAVVTINLMLGLFNLLPIPPMDGHHIARAIPALQGPMDKFTDFVAQNRMLAFVGLMFLAPVLMQPIFFIVNIVMNVLLLTPIPGLSHAIGHVASVSPGLPGLAFAAAFLAIQSILPADPSAARPEGGKRGPDGAVSKPADFILEIPAEKLKITKNIHLKSVNPNLPDAAERGRAFQAEIEGQLSGVVRQEAAGSESLIDILRRYGAVPYATYEGVNMTTIRMDAESAAALSAELSALGIKVWDNYRLELPKPQDNPEPKAKAVTLKEMLKIVNADKVQDIVRQKYGPPDVESLGPVSRGLTKMFMKLIGAENPRIDLVIIDSSVDRESHPNLKRAVKQILNATSADDKDDIGHGTHTTSTIFAVDPWQRDITMVKAFVGGGATLDDILRAQTLSADKGIASSNSWGNSRGDVSGPEAKKAIQNAEAGQIGVFAAGNSGPYANTIGSPAIAVVRGPNGAYRIVAVAATNRNKDTSRFSSRGGDRQPGKPDIATVGENLEAQWPGDLGDHDRIDPELGAVKAISGTSMATPGVAGAISLLARAFGVTKPGPELDKIVNAVLEQAAKTGKPETEQGKGFLDVYAAYKSVEGAGLKAYKSTWTRTVYRGIGGVFKVLERVGSKAAPAESRAPGLLRRLAGPTTVGVVAFLLMGASPVGAILLLPLVVIGSAFIVSRMIASRRGERVASLQGLRRYAVGLGLGGLAAQAVIFGIMGRIDPAGYLMYAVASGALVDFLVPLALAGLSGLALRTAQNPPLKPEAPKTLARKALRLGLLASPGILLSVIGATPVLAAAMVVISLLGLVSAVGFDALRQPKMSGVMYGAASVLTVSAAAIMGLAVIGTLLELLPILLAPSALIAGAALAALAGRSLRPSGLSANESGSPAPAPRSSVLSDIRSFWGGNAKMAALFGAIGVGVGLLGHMGAHPISAVVHLAVGTLGMGLGAVLIQRGKLLTPKWWLGAFTAVVSIAAAAAGASGLAVIAVGAAAAFLAGRSVSILPMTLAGLGLPAALGVKRAREDSRGSELPLTVGRVLLTAALVIGVIGGLAALATWAMDSFFSNIRIEPTPDPFMLLGGALFGRAALKSGRSGPAGLSAKEPMGPHDETPAEKAILIALIAGVVAALGGIFYLIIKILEGIHNINLPTDPGSWGGF